MSEHQDYIDAFKEWQQTYKPGEFIEYSHEAYEALLAESDKRLVWTHHGTCENEQYTNGIREYNSVCGCWQVFGWYICETPWESGDEEYVSVDVEWSGPCDTCNEDGSDENINQECPTCDGEGYTQDYFD